MVRKKELNSSLISKEYLNKADLLEFEQYYNFSRDDKSRYNFNTNVIIIPVND